MLSIVRPLSVDPVVHCLLVFLGEKENNCVGMLQL